MKVNQSLAMKIIRFHSSRSFRSSWSSHAKTELQPLECLQLSMCSTGDIRGYGHLDTVSTLSRSLQSALIPDSEHVIGIEKTGCHTGVDCWCNMIVVFQKMGDRSMGLRMLRDCVTCNSYYFCLTTAPQWRSLCLIWMSHLNLGVCRKSAHTYYVYWGYSFAVS